MTSSSEGEILQSGQIIRDRWKINKKVGGGGFGEIFDAFDLQNHNERVAIKVESSKATKQVLKMEVAVLRRLQGKKHACKFYGCGRNDKFNYLVMSLQGKNLADLRRESPRQCFSVSTAIRLGLQILLSIKEIHSIGFLHRDIKPSNFAMGRSQSSLRMVYMLDFGLARQYLNAKGEIRSPRSAAGFRGTVRYAAVTAHKNKEMGRSDDLYSFFYIIVEFLQGALPWRKIKDKDEVGRMKEEVNYETLLEGCPQELHEIPTHLKTLGYPDDPDYDMLEKILRGILARLQIHMDDPYDWELGYENISGRSRTTTTTNGNVSTRMKSHTTAVKDRGPEEKNRALDTQAPITMGEDDDEQTGNCYRLPPMNSAHTAGKEFDDRQDKPKYKRQEFMRPKYGAVSFDVIDAVNARLAAASVGEKSSNNDFFNRIRYDTSIENDKINESNNPDVVVDFNIRPTMIQSPSNLDNPNNRGAMTAPGTPLTNRAHRNPLQSQPINDQRTSKSNRSITLSVNKKFPTGGSSRQKMGSYNTSGEGTHAFADGSGYNKAAAGATTTASRWHDSFDETGDDDPILPIDANSAIPRSPMNNRFPRTILSPQQPTQAESSAIASSSPSSNNINNNNNNATTTAKNEGYISPRLMRRSISASKSAAPLASADSGLGGSPVTNGSHNSASSTIMSHFKNLVNSFNIGSGSGHSRRRSLSRGISLDDHRSITNAQKPSTTSSTHATPNIYRRSEEPKDRQTLEDEERELRRQRRLRRRSDCQQMLPEKQQLQQQQNQDRYHYKYDHGSTSPVPSRRTIIPSVQKTVIVNNDGAYRVESRLMNNGVVVESTPPPLEDKKSSQSCRRKRYQFLNFAPRAMSKS